MSETHSIEQDAQRARCPACGTVGSCTNPDQAFRSCPDDDCPVVTWDRTKQDGEGDA